MKKLAAVCAGLVIITLSACTESAEDTLVHLQPHDSNQMMGVMHTMMAEMDKMQPTGDPEIDFSMMMKMHHQGAINMANIELQKGTNDSLKRIAQKIIAEQQMEIQQFNALLDTIKVDNNVAIFPMKQMENMMKMGKNSDVQFISGDTDNDFAALMIPHHQSAIDNSQAYLDYGNNEQLKAMAKKIIEAQEKEIKELAEWLKTNKR